MLLSDKIKEVFGKKRKKRMMRSDPMFEYEIFLKPGALEAIKKAKGFKRWSDLADALKITKQYLSNLNGGRVGVSHSLIVRIAVILNNVSGSWWTFYEIRPTKRRLHINSPVFNQEKEKGQMPYQTFSPSGAMRSVDGKVEFQELTHKV